MTEMTRSQAIAADINALLRARNPLLWVVTREEARVERYIVEAARAAGYMTSTWDIAQGVTDLMGRALGIGVGDPDGALEEIKARAIGDKADERTVWIMRDFGPLVTAPLGMVTQRRLRNLARLLPGIPGPRAQAVIVVSAGGEVPPELADHATAIDWPLPDRAEIADILDATLGALSDEDRTVAAPNGNRDAAIDAAVGLTGEQAQACYARSLVQLRHIDPATVAQEKKRVIAREGGLEWYDPLPGGLDAVGGLENLKEWLVSRAIAWSPGARTYGLRSPRGALLVGVSGCGKSMSAKAIATAWGVPLLKLDLGAQKSKYVGESEGKIRNSLRIVDVVGRCVLWIDEIEKSLQGATSGAADGGVSADALGTVLTWMQERTGEAFVIATANDVTSLPPELMRKGRFDEIWSIDLPTAEERAAILTATLRTHGRDPETIDVTAVANVTPEFAGAEIAELVPDAMFVAFADGGREITTEDLVDAARKTQPLSRTAAEKIAALRKWADGRARSASAPKAKATAAVAATSAGRVLDLGN
jgi:hypothetical protein